MTTNDQRRAPRVSHPFMIRYRPLGTDPAGWLVSPLQDLSRGGARFLSERPFYVGMVLEAQLLLPFSRDPMPLEARVAFFGEARGYYLDRPYAWCDSLNPGYVDYASFQSSRDLRDDLVKKGFTHILYNSYTNGYRGYPEYHARADRMIAEFFRLDTAPVVVERGVVIAHIN